MIDLDKFVASAGDAIVAADREGKIVLWNAAAERALRRRIETLDAAKGSSG